MFLVAALVFGVACGPSPRDTNIEEVKFVLDFRGWASAISHSSQVLEQGSIFLGRDY